MPKILQVRKPKGSLPPNESWIDDPYPVDPVADVRDVGGV